MEKLNWTIALLLISSVSLFGQADQDTTDHWDAGGLFNINFSQVALQNWIGGGQNSISTTGNLDLYADYSKGKASWNNALLMSYGLISQNKSPLIKSDDNMEFSSKYGRKIKGNFFFSGLLGFDSQFQPGYEFPLEDSIKNSDFLAPGYVMTSLGFSYQRPSVLDIFLAPVAGKMTIVNNDRLSEAGAFGVTPGQKIREEFGGHFKLAVRKEIVKNTTFKTKLELFSNYLDQPQNIDVNWQFLLAMKVNSFITTSISTDLIYDDDIMIPVDTDDDGIPDKQGPRVQMKEVINIGISINFNDDGGFMAKDK